MAVAVPSADLDHRRARVQTLEEAGQALVRAAVVGHLEHVHTRERQTGLIN
jgi:hypothetical protein